VDAGRNGYRLDRFVGARIGRLSRNRIQAIIAAGHVYREGEADPILRASTRVHEGDVVLVMRPAPREPTVVLRYDVLFEDDALLVIDKAAGLPVHPSGRYHRNTLTALMRERLGAGHGWVMAHRLDRETSGVMVFGRSGPGSAALKRAFVRRRVKKEYLALCRGRLAEAMSIDVPLGIGGSRIRIKMNVRSPDEGGLDARTDVEPIAFGSFRGEDITLVKASPRTGRQHQIRAHLAHAGHPVLGDKMYGIDEQWFIDVSENGRPMAELDEHLGLDRHALHAQRIELPHPTTGEPVEFEAPWPDDLARILRVP
jgi:23S rRNA pseudouridine1911/1915/1917 synthase